jgi:hypothetical protein
MADILTDINALASIGGSIALIVSVWLLILEVRTNNRLARAANAQAMVELSGPLYLSQVQDRSLAEFCDRCTRDYQSLDEVDRQRYRNWLIWWLIFHENVFYQRRQSLLDDRAFRPWSRDLQLFIEQQNLAQHWGELKHLFQDEFSDKVSHLIANLPEAERSAAAVFGARPSVQTDAATPPNPSPFYSCQKKT